MEINTKEINEIIVSLKTIAFVRDSFHPGGNHPSSSTLIRASEVLANITRKQEAALARLSCLRDALIEVARPGYGFDLIFTETERGDYWSEACRRIRKIARDALAADQAQPSDSTNKQTQP